MLVFLLSFFASSKLTIQPHEERAFLAWMRQYNHIFTGTEYHIRFGIFLAKSRWINDFNRGKHTYRLGLNSFSCHTPAELAAMLSTPIDATRIPHTRFVSRAIRADIPDSLDWRDNGVVTGVKAQNFCGSCWAFGTIQACESAYALVHFGVHSRHFFRTGGVLFYETFHRRFQAEHGFKKTVNGLCPYFLTHINLISFSTGSIKSV